MKKIETEKFLDGIAFYIGDCEVAFYSDITKNLRYNKNGIEKAFPETKFYKCIEVPFRENLVIVEMAKEYILKQKYTTAK